jgi:hypothetical protein
MPKWSEPSAKAAVTEDDYDADSVVVSKPLTRREEARMKNKKNLLAKKQQRVDHPEKGKPGMIRSFENVEAGEEEEERQKKRTRSSVKSDVDTRP